jgi:NADP-dependent 3-hydroxy acid dehydrogenase YdfG
VPNPIVLSGASVAITGAARGIGYATARAFVAEGARVFIGDLDGELAKTAADELGCAGAQVDVRSRDSLAEFLAGIEPPVQVLVNNAGIMPAGRFADESDVVTDAIVDVNLNGVLRATKLVLPGMVQRGCGHIATCRARPPIVAVPGWMRSYEAVAALVPDRVVGAVRGRLTRQRVLRTLDAGARAGYEERVRRDIASG